MAHERLTLEDTNMSAVMKLSGGNPGAMRVCSEILKHGAEIDPQVISGVGHLLSIDSLGLYGPRLWLLYKDICGENLVLTITVLRAWQLGFLSEQDLQLAVDQKAGIAGGPRVNIEPVKLFHQVKDRLGNFGHGFDPPQKSEPVEPAESASPQPTDVDRVINLD